MRRHCKKVVLLLVGVALVACFLFALPSGEIEPTYEGRRLSDVLSEPPALDRGIALVQRERIAEGLLHMGTNALPYLVKWACTPTPKWRTTLAQFCQSHPRIFPDALTRRLTKSDNLAERAMITLADLGTNAYPAILQLLQITNDTQSVRRAKRAADCLDHIKAEHRREIPRPAALAAHNGSSISLGFPRNTNILGPALSDTNPVIRQAAAIALTNHSLTWP